MHLLNCMLAALAGALVPIQAGINAQLRSTIGNPYYATLISVLVSTVSVALFCLITQQALPKLESLAQVPWWAWTGGVIGVIFVCLLLSLAPKLGATLMVATIIAGQLICSVILDQFALLGYKQHSIDLNRVLGLALLAGGVYFIQRN